MAIPAPVLWTTASAVYFLVLYRASRFLSPWLVPQYKKLYIGVQRDWDSRLGSTVHALVVTLLALYYICFTDTFTDDARFGRIGSMAATDQTTSIVSVSLGYFLIDLWLIVINYPALGGRPMIGHHLIGIACLLTTLVNRKAHAYALAGLFMEVTTPCVNIMFWCQKLERKDNLLYKVNGVVLVLLWLFFRIVVAAPGGLYIIKHYSELRMLPWYGKALVTLVPFALLALNVMWFQKLVAGALKMLTKQSKPKEA